LIGTSETVYETQETFGGQEVPEKTFEGAINTLSSEEQLVVYWNNVKHLSMIISQAHKVCLEAIMAYDKTPEVFKLLGKLKKKTLNSLKQPYVKWIKEERAKFEGIIKVYDEKAYSEEELPKEEGFNLEVYEQKYFPVETFNYQHTSNWSGIFEYQDQMSHIEKRVDAADNESQNLLNALWKWKIENESSHKGVLSLMDTFQDLTNVFSRESLNKALDPENFNKEFDEPTLLSELAIINDVIQGFSRLIESTRESPYIIEFYSVRGFENFFHLYHWLRAVCPLLE